MLSFYYAFEFQSILRKRKNPLKCRQIPATRESRGRNSAEEEFSRNRTIRVWAKKFPVGKLRAPLIMPANQKVLVEIVLFYALLSGFYSLSQADFFVKQTKMSYTGNNDYLFQ
jgi:hypothetical protein